MATVAERIETANMPRRASALVVARRELRDHWRDGRIRIALGFTMVLLLSSVVFGAVAAREAEQQRKAAQRLMRQQWLDQGVKNPHSAAHYGIWAFRPVPALALLDPGIHPYTGVTVWLEAHKRNEFRYRPVRDAIMVSRFPALTGATMLQLLIPLLIILLGYAALSAERESGLLGYQLSLGLSRRTLLTGKVLALGASLTVVLVPAAALSTILLFVQTPAAEREHTLAVLAALAILYGLYYAVILLLTLAVSAWAPSPRVAILVLFAFWSTTHLLAPRAAGELARSLHPTPSAAEFQRSIAEQVRLGIDGHSPLDERAEALRRQVLLQYGKSDLDSLPVNFSGLALQAGEEYGNGVYEEHYQRLWSAFNRQHVTHQTVSLFAPIIALRSVTSGLAGTDWYRQQRIAEAAESWRRTMVKAMNDEVTYRSIARAYAQDVRGREVWQQVSDLSFQPEPFLSALARQSRSAAMLGFWLVTSLAFALWATTRMRVI